MARHGRNINKLRSKNSASVKTNLKDSTITAWNKREDIPLDEEDQFHHNRDKILLDDEYESINEEQGDEEVFALNGLESSSEEEDVDGDDLSQDINSADVYKKRVAKLKSPAAPQKTSPSESSSSDDDEVLGWGKKSAYYSSNAQQIDSDDEEANEMEEQEARRLQSKLRDTMKEEDFGVDDIQDLLVHEPDLSFEKPEIVGTSEDKKSIIQNLYKTHPETIALADEFDDIAHAVMATESKITELGDAAYEGKSSKLDGMFHLYHQAQLMYASLVAFYLFLRASKKYTSNPDLLNSHPIMNRLLVLKRSISTIENLNLNDSEDESTSEDDYSLGSDELDGLTRDSMLGKDELMELLREEGLRLRKRKDVSISDDINLTKVSHKKRKKKSKTAADQETLLSELQEPMYKPMKKAIRTQPSTSDIFGEATSLDYADAADKGARRKTLQFHTSKIESTTARRHGARNAVSGDDDIPYRQRRKEKEQALVKQRRNLGQGGDDLDDLDPEPQESIRKRSRDDSDEESNNGDGDDYYDLVHKSKKLKKEQKKADYELQREVTRPDYDAEVTAGQRSVSRAILANKGLTPHRAKSVRNPRVKKRKKFDKAKRKLSSQKAIYKGGLRDIGRYEGERSGITKVAKGIRF